MEDFTLPSVGARFKKWECYTPFSPKMPGPSPNFPITPKNKNKQKNWKKRGSGRVTSSKHLQIFKCEDVK
jgi:hypothetical protein